MQMFSPVFVRSAQRVVALSALGLLAACSSNFPLLSSADKTSVYSNTPTSNEGEGVKFVEPTGLAKWWGVLTPYKVPIQQGNFISQEMVGQLKEGMTREQVRDLLGTPLLTDMFHEDRWDYPFRLKGKSGYEISSRVTVHFKNNTVAKFEGGNLPAEKEYLSRISEASLGANRVQSVTGQEDSSKKKPK